MAVSNNATATVFTIGGKPVAPRISTDRSGNGTDNTTPIETSEQQIDSGSNRNPTPLFDLKTKRGRKGGKTDEKTAGAAAATILNVIDMSAVMRYGAPGKMLPNERGMMQDGLTITMSKLPLSINQQIGDVTAPMMAAFGLVMYLTRLSKLENDRRSNTTAKSAEKFLNQTATPSTPTQPPVQPRSPSQMADQYRTPSKEELFRLQEGI